MNRIPYVLLYLAVTAFAAWNTLMCLRAGAVTFRNGRQITRTQDPVYFWISISLGLGALALLLWMGVWFAYQISR